MRRIVVLNAKGGAGKTTLAINLAALYAGRGFRTGMIDHDPQRSSLDWLERRPQERPRIHGVPGLSQPNLNVTQSWQMRMPEDVQRVLVDTPARPDRQQIQALLRHADVVLVPILPSAIDTKAASRFIGELLLAGRLRQSGCRLGIVASRVRQSGCRLGIVASRVRRSTQNYQRLRGFLDSLEIPFVGSIRDAPVYLEAAEYGLGASEMHEPALSGRESRAWEQIFRWLEQESPALSSGSVQAPGSLYGR